MDVAAALRGDGQGDVYGPDSRWLPGVGNVPAAVSSAPGRYRIGTAYFKLARTNDRSSDGTSGQPGTDDRAPLNRLLTAFVTASGARHRCPTA